MSSLDGTLKWTGASIFQLSNRQVETSKKDGKNEVQLQDIARYVIKGMEEGGLRQGVSFTDAINSSKVAWYQTWYHLLGGRTSQVGSKARCVNIQKISEPKFY
jgi:hypothetical protein